MHEIRNSNPPMAAGICDSNKSRAGHHRSLKLGSKLKYLNWWDMLFKSTIDIYYFRMVYQSTSSSEYLFLSFSWGFLLFTTSSFFNFNLSTSSLLINFTINYTTTWFPSLSSLQSSESFHLVRVSSFFLLFFGCCGCCLPYVGLVYIMKDIDNIYCIRYIVLKLWKIIGIPCFVKPIKSTFKYYF